MPDLSHEANFHPSLIISAPEFSYCEGDEDDDSLEPLKDSSHVTPKKTLSVDDALAAENSNRDSSHYAQVLSIKAPDFTAEETCSEEQLNYARSSLDLASVTENEKQGHGNEKVPRSTENNSSFKYAESCDFGRNESTEEFGSVFSDGW